MKFIHGLRVVDSIEKTLKIYRDNIMSLQYFTLTTTSQVVLPNTLTLSFMLLKSKSRIIP